MLDLRGICYCDLKNIVPTNNLQTNKMYHELFILAIPKNYKCTYNINILELLNLYEENLCWLCRELHIV